MLSQPVAAAESKVIVLDADKGAGLNAFDDDGETTDMGHGSSSETESASGMSDCSHGVGGHSVSWRCRFGRTPLETIPATPVASAEQLGLSFASAMSANQDDAFAVVDEVHPIASRPCRFGTTPLGTLPTTPPKVRQFKALAKALGSPPGLSRAVMRQARDAVKADPVALPSWGRGEVSLVLASATPLKVSHGGSPVTPPGLRSAKSRAAREALLMRANQCASLLKVEAQSRRNAKGTADASQRTPGITEFTPARRCMQKAATTIYIDDLVESERIKDEGREVVSEESSSESSGAEASRCRFGGSALGTVPATPVAAAGCEAAPSSPPGLSRKAAMRQARDACNAPGVPLSAATALFSSTAPPATPPAVRIAKRRMARDSMLARARQEGPTTWFGHMPQAALSTVPR